MIRNRRATHRMGWTAGFACAATIVLPLSISNAQDEPAKDKSSSEPAAAATKPVDDVRTAQLRKAIDRTVPELSFQEVGFSDVVDFLHDVSGVNFVVEWKGLEAAGIDRHTPVTTKLRNEKLSDVLRLVLGSIHIDQTRLTYRIDPEANAIVIAVGKPAAARPSKALQAKLGHKLPDLKLQNVSLEDTLKFLQDTTGANLVANWGTLKAIGIDRNTPVNLKLKNVAFAELLSALDGKQKLTYIADGDVIVISTIKQN